MAGRGAVLAVALLGGGLCPPPARADVGPPTLLVRLGQRARETQTLQGDFTQHSRVKLFKKVLESRGRFAYQRPRRIRWQFLSPDPSLLILDGDKATLSMPDFPPQSFDLKKDAVMRAVFEQVELWLGGESIADAERDYVVEPAGTAAAPMLRLTPRAGSFVERSVRGIELRFDRALELRSILLREPSGDEKEIEFTRMERNARLALGTFTP